jgi:hypothetical protein
LPLGKEDRIPEDEVILDSPDGEAIEEFPEVDETKFVPLPELDLEEDGKYYHTNLIGKKRFQFYLKRITRSETKKAKASSQSSFLRKEIIDKGCVFNKYFIRLVQCKFIVTLLYYCSL